MVNSKTVVLEYYQTFQNTQTIIDYYYSDKKSKHNRYYTKVPIQLYLNFKMVSVPNIRQSDFPNETVNKYIKEPHIKNDACYNSNFIISISLTIYTKQISNLRKD